MQLPTEADAGGLAQSPTPGGGLPPQAQTGLPAMAADLADIAPAPPPEQPLLQAAFGDKGAQQYQALRAAGQAAPTGAGVPEAPLGGVSGLPGPQGASNVLVGGLQGLMGHPEAGAQLARQQQQMQLQLNEEFRRNASEFYTALMPAAFKQFPGRPDLAASFLLQQARNRGLQVDPAVLMKLNQDITDGKLTESEIDKVISDPTTPVSTIERIGNYAKFGDDLAKGRAEAQEAVARAPYAAPRAREELRGQQLGNDMKQMDVDSFYDNVEKRVVAEAKQYGYQPGTPEYTNYVENRKNQIAAAAKKMALEQTPLSGREEDDFVNADRVGKFAQEALKLLNDPRVAANRGVVEGRLRNLAWQLGFASSPAEDLYQSVSNISGLMGSKVYSGGIRNMKWIDRVLEHTLRPGDELALVKDKVNVLLRAAREQQQGILNVHGRAASTLEPTVPPVVFPGEGGAPGAPAGAGAGTLSPTAQNYFDSLTTGGASPAP